MDKERILETLYDNLETQLTVNRKKKMDSVLLSFFNMKSNTRLEMIRESSEKFDHAHLKLIESMVDEGLVREEEDGSVTITGKGIWKYENERFLSVDQLILYIDDKFFSAKSNTKKLLTSKEKVILLSMIALRAFSLDYCLDLRKSDNSLNTIEAVTEDVYDLALDIGLIKDLEKENLFGKEGNEHKVSNLYRHTDDLPKMTSFIFRAPGNQKYFLDVKKEEVNEIDENKLAKLISKILEKHDIVIEEGNNHVIRLIDKLQHIAYEQGIGIYETPSESYISPDYDSTIVRSIEMGIFET